MYYPILRGRQFELIAIRELVEHNLLNDEKVIPIVEPVKLSATYLKTLKVFKEKEQSIAIVQNPEVGTFRKDLENDKYHSLLEELQEINNKNEIPVWYLTKDFVEGGADYVNEKSLLICNERRYLENLDKLNKEGFLGSFLVPDKKEYFRKLEEYKKIICEDYFDKKDRNSDYLEDPDQTFSEDYLYFRGDGYLGFSDYSIIGSKYNESGFAPFAVAIHIIYKGINNELRVKHFVSDTNDDIRDPAKKFSEAAKKLKEWNKKEKLDSLGLRLLVKAYDEQRYPGLGVVKKLTLMHHLELMSNLSYS